MCEKLWWTYILYKRGDKMNYICHHGVKGMKWGVRRYQNKDGSLTSEGKERYSVEERKRNSKELNDTISRSRANNDTGRPSAEEVWKTSATMQKFSKITKNDYKKRNDIYDGKIDVPNDVKKKYGYVFNDHELRVYGYGEKFHELMKKKASELVYDEKDVQTIMKLVEEADWNNINSDTYNKNAWLYWH